MLPPPIQQPPPFPFIDPQAKDKEHLDLLAVFHFVFAGLTVLGLGFLGVHFLVMRTVFLRHEAHGAMSGAGRMPADQVFTWIVVGYVFMALLVIAVGTANVLSGIWLKKRKNRMFSMILAGFNCLQMPFGTALGVFTLIVLARPGVRQLYGEKLV